MWTQLGKLKQSLTLASRYIYHFLLAAGHSVWQKVVNVNALTAYCFAIFHSVCADSKTIFYFRPDV